MKSEMTRTRCERVADEAGLSPEDLSTLHRTAREAAQCGAEILMAHYGQLSNIRSKGRQGDLVTEADEAAEAAVLQLLKETTPHIGILAEESGRFGADSGLQWMVDPLDGTTNFLHGLPHWAVSIALEHKGQLVAAVVYDPTKDEMFVAEKGAGAWMNEMRIRVSPRYRVEDSLYATGIPFSGRAGDLPETLQDLAKLMPACAGVRRFGAASLDLAYVAAARYDGFWERGLKSWDMAAGLLIAKEAGALVEGLTPDTDPMETGDVIVASEA